MQEQWRAFEDAQRAGLSRAIGVANFCVATLDCILRKASTTPQVNQVNFHVGLADPEHLRSYCSARGITLQAYGATMGTDTSNAFFCSASANNSRAMQKAARDAKDGILELASQIGDGYGKSAYQVLLRWLAEKNIPAIMASRNVEHLRDNLDAVTFRLSQEEVDALDGVKPWPVAPGCAMGRLDAFGIGHPWGGFVTGPAGR